MTACAPPASGKSTTRLHRLGVGALASGKEGAVRSVLVLALKGLNGGLFVVAFALVAEMSTDGALEA